MIELFKDWFPGGVHQSTPFGWDPNTVPGVKRMHFAGDWAVLKGRRLIDKPRALISGTVEWLPQVGSSSCLRLINYYVEIDYYHHRRDELSSAVIAALTVKGAEIQAGEEIGPIGDVGLSVSYPGVDPSHEHLVMKFRPDMTEDLGYLLGKGWNDNKLGEFRKAYGPAFDAEVKAKRIEWMNDVALLRFDPLSQAYRIFVDPARILGQ